MFHSNPYQQNNKSGEQAVFWGGGGKVIRSLYSIDSCYTIYF